MMGHFKCLLVVSYAAIGTGNGGDTGVLRKGCRRSGSQVGVGVGLAEG